MEVDFSEIPPGRCSPALDGLYVSHEGALELVRGMRRTEHSYQVQAIELESARHICEVDLRVTKDELAHADDDRKWALVGKVELGVGVAAVVVTVGGVAIKVITEDDTKARR